MSIEQLAVERSPIQEAIWRVALSLDAFLVNGIPNGVLDQGYFPGFLEKVAANLLRDLAGLEEQVRRDGNDQPSVQSALAALRTGCDQLIAAVTGLVSFRTLSLDEMRLAVGQVRALREACVRRIQELETALHHPTRFYSTRPADAAAGVNDFLTNLEPLFVQAWHGRDE